MARTDKSRRTPDEKRRSARKGAVAVILAAAVALPLTLATGSCGQEHRRRRELARVVTGNENPMARRLTICGAVRRFAPADVSEVPCQVWNLMPLFGFGVIAAGWLVLDLLGVDRRGRE